MEIFDPAAFEEPLGLQPSGAAERVVARPDGAAPDGSRAFEELAHNGLASGGQIRRVPHSPGDAESGLCAFEKPLGVQPSGAAERVVSLTDVAAPGGSRASEDTEPDSLPVFDWQKAELARRKENLLKNPNSVLQWEDVKRNIRSVHRP